jgi:ankyrin repeat protein
MNKSMSTSATRVTLIDLVSTGQYAEVAKLVNSDKRCVYEKTDLGYSAVLAAVERNDFKMLQLLADAGASLTQADSFGDTPLGRARENRYSDIEAFLVSRINEGEK